MKAFLLKNARKLLCLHSREKRLSSGKGERRVFTSEHDLKVNRITEGQESVRRPPASVHNSSQLLLYTVFFKLGRWTRSTEVICGQVLNYKSSKSCTCRRVLWKELSSIGHIYPKDQYDSGITNAKLN